MTIDGLSIFRVCKTNSFSLTFLKLFMRFFPTTSSSLIDHIQKHQRSWSNYALFSSISWAEFPISLQSCHIFYQCPIVNFCQPCQPCQPACQPRQLTQSSTLSTSFSHICQPCQPICLPLSTSSTCLWSWCSCALGGMIARLGALCLYIYFPRRPLFRLGVSLINKK